MRTFNTFEQEIIRRAIDLDDKEGSLNVLGNILSSSMSGVKIPSCCYIKVTSPTDVTIQIKSDDLEHNTANYGTDWIRKLDDDLTRKLLTIVTLFDYLSENRLAFFVGDMNFEVLGEKWTDVEYLQCDFLDKETKELLYKYTRKKIYISETLKVIVGNGFKTDEEIKTEKIERHNKNQLLLTQLAVFFTFIGLVVSIVLPIFGVTVIDIKNNSVPVDIIDSVPNQIEISSGNLSSLIEGNINSEKRLIIKVEKLIELQETNKGDAQNAIEMITHRIAVIENSHNNGFHWTPKSYAPFRYAPRRATSGSQ